MRNHDTVTRPSDLAAPVGSSRHDDAGRTPVPARVRPAWASALSSRWPLAVGLVVAATMLDGASAETALLGAATVYAVSAVLGHRGVAWPAFGLVLVLVGATRLLGVETTTWVVLLVVPALLWRTVGRRARRGPVAVPLLALLAFAGPVVAMTVLPGGVCLHVVALLLLAHAAWDVACWVRELYVTRSLAEFCAALDLALGAGLLVLL